MAFLIKFDLLLLNQNLVILYSFSQFFIINHRHHLIHFILIWHHHLNHSLQILNPHYYQLLQYLFDGIIIIFERELLLLVPLRILFL